MNRRIHIFVLAVLLTLPVVTSAQEAVGALAQRLLGNDSRHFVFTKVAAESDTFFIAPAADGKSILIGGNNDISMAVGLNYYFRKYAKVHVSWFDTEPLQLPKHWPVPPQAEGGRAVVPQRVFLNYCTYGYTMVWWKWPQWERFIEWMALNGINMPLALTGQEAVWQEVWREMGMTDDEIRAYFSGPAHLPWHRMANLDGFGGPLPQSWIDGQKELQKQILERERVLGMTPVLPAFAGHVPSRITELNPQADIKRLSPWCGFEATCFLNSTAPLFADIQRRYLAKQQSLYGTDHIYGVDPFNEMDPPSWEPDYLAAVSANIYRTLQQSDPEARWLQMSWVFYYKRKQWMPERLRAYLTAVPQDSLVLLDYFCEKTEVWRNTLNEQPNEQANNPNIRTSDNPKTGFYGQPFIWCYLGNFGGNTMLVGDLYALENKLKAALAESNKNLIGLGSTLEGFDCSPQTYEYLFASVWGLSVNDFVDQWADMRYGKENKDVRQAWHLLADSVYKDWSFYGLGTQMVARPDFEGHGTYYTKPYYSYNNERLLEAVRLLMNNPSKRYGYEYDIVNFLSQWMGNRFMDLRNAFTEAYKAGDTAAMLQAYMAAERLMSDADKLLCSKVEFRFSKWVYDARQWGGDDIELLDYYGIQAHTLLTVWGGPVLNDYANRLWGGLLKTYYWGERWKPFFEGALQARREGNDFDEEAFKHNLSEREQDYARRVSNNMPYKILPQTVQQARIILKRIDQGVYNP